MTEIMMLPIEWLEHHPDNPRKDLGDLKELKASIAESGIMQNLTVVPRSDGENGYWVVIGNRRLEASRALGLKQLPCIISDMDHKTQLATMMAENMQRVDLTLLEQAQGVQVMMDLGMDIDAIARKTGLRKDAIRRRTLITKHDELLARAAIERGATLMDFVQLDKVEDEAVRKKLLLQMGTAAFANQLRWALEEQERKRINAAMVEKLDLWATEIQQIGKVGIKDVPMQTVRTYYNPTWDTVEELEPPEDIRDVRYYFLRGTSHISLYREALESTPEDPVRLKARRETEWVSEHVARARQVDKVLHDMRRDFILNSPDLRIDEHALLSAYIRACATGAMRKNIAKDNIEAFEQMCGAKVDKSGMSVYIKDKDIIKAISERRSMTALALIWALLDTDYEWDVIYGGAEGTRIVHKPGKVMPILYDLLMACGYKPCDEEVRYLEGTHEIYARMEDEK